MVRLLRKYMVSIIVVLLLTIALVLWNKSRSFDDTVMASVPNYTDIDVTSILAADDIQTKLGMSFYSYYKVHNDKGAQDSEGYSLSIPSTEYSAISSKGTSVESGIGDRPGDALALIDEDSWVEYAIEVPQDAYYQLGMSYYAMPGKRSSVVRSVQIDGEYPFFQAKKIEFQRMWRESGETWFDNQGNEFNPKREEVKGWQYRDFRDSEGKVGEPLRFFLTAGKHIIRINAIREPAAIGELNVFSPVQLPSYEEVLKGYKEKGYKEVANQVVKIQAEKSILRSSPTLKRIEDREPLTEPFNKNASILNIFGGAGWRDGGQWAEWDFEVPESGLYNIGMRFGQWFINGIPVQRTVMIDGKIPFKEMNEVLYPYKPNFQVKVLGDDKPFLFYLEKGKHTMRMEVQVGSLGPILESIVNTTRMISFLSREIIHITGTNPDPNADWKLEKNIENLVPRLHIMARDLDGAVHKLYDLGVPEGSSEVSTLYEARDEILSMAQDTTTIPARLKALTDLQSSLGTWANGLVKQSLVLDYILVQSSENSWPPAEASWYVRAGTSLYDLAHSFTKDYGGVGNVYEGEEVLDVWVARGRDWVDIIKQMIDEDFTPETGIKVNVNVIPAQQMQLLMLANTSGLAPDVALGVEGEVPIDFAVRNALVNLNDFPDYKEVVKQFRPGALIPYKYNGGDFAIPENQNFYMLFYRKDIMEELGITEDQIPQTWQEVMDLIPLLQQNGMDFYYPHAPNAPNSAINEFAPFLFQHGGGFYRENGKLSDIDSPQALEAMKMWTGLFTNYKIQKQADFYNRFRTGEMPIGVADYSTYILLSTAAPELTGWWGMQPMPGIKQPDGQINRSTGGLAQTGIIFKSSKKQEKSWEFLKWWTGADAQERFGSELEALLGVEARWNTANVDALKRLPWNQSDLDGIMKQWEWFKEREIVLGGYYTTRYIANMWNEIVLNGKIPREAIEDGVKEIDKELRKKREEFGLDEEAAKDERP